MVLKPGVGGLYGRPCDKFNLTVVSDLYYLLASRWKIFLHITKLAVCLHTAKQLNNTVPSSRCVVVVSASWWIMNAVVFRGDHCLVEKCVCVFSFSSFFSFLCAILPPENLEPHSAPMEIGHQEVGRYFSEFSDTHYVANEDLCTRYPEDMSETASTVQQLYHRLTTSPDGQQRTTAWVQNTHQSASM